MIEIHTTNGFVAFVDDIDADLAALSWAGLITKSGTYARRRKSKKYAHILVSEYLHRNILSRILGRLLSSDEQVDHINKNSLDNRRSNIRLATPMQNTYNRGRSSKNTSGYKGVSFHKGEGKWYAQIKAGKKHRALGYFSTPEEAYAAYCEAAKELHGEFARLE